MADKTDNKIKLLVVTPYKNFYEGMVSSVTIPSSDGEFGIMAGHSPLVLALTPGVAHVRVDSETKHFVVSEGYAQISAQTALLVCNSAEWPDDLVARKILDSYTFAKDEMAKRTDSDYVPAVTIESVDPEQVMKRALARKHLLEMYGNEQQKTRVKEIFGDI